MQQQIISVNFFHQLFPAIVFETPQRSARGYSAPRDNAFNGVESEVAAKAPGAATSPTTYTLTVRNFSSETSTETSRNCERNNFCTDSCTSPSDRPETKIGPASGSVNRPSWSTVRSKRWEIPPHKSIDRL